MHIIKSTTIEWHEMAIPIRIIRGYGCSAASMGQACQEGQYRPVCSRSMGGVMKWHNRSRYGG